MGLSAEERKILEDTRDGVLRNEGTLKNVVKALDSGIGKGKLPYFVNHPTVSDAKEEIDYAAKAKEEQLAAEDLAAEKMGAPKCERMGKHVFPRIVGAGQGDVTKEDYIPLFLEKHSCWHLYNDDECYPGENRHDPSDELKGCPIFKEIHKI